MVYLRKATDADKDILFEWANDPVVRESSFSTEPIPYDIHEKWFDRIMNNDAIEQYIMMDQDMPVGQIRLNIDRDEAEIDYSIASEFRGKGYGRKLIRLIAKEVSASSNKITKLTAKVKPENTASKNLFESEGYIMKYVSYIFEMRGGYGELSSFNVPCAALLVDICDRRSAS